MEGYGRIMSTDERMRFVIELFGQLAKHRDLSGCDICTPIVADCSDAECHCLELLSCPEYKKIRADIEGVLIGLEGTDIDQIAFLLSRGNRRAHRDWLETLTEAVQSPVALRVQ